jgi:hypothetical protein
VLRIMCFKQQFVTDNYRIPLQFYKNRVRQIAESIDRKCVNVDNNNATTCFCSIRGHSFPFQSHPYDKIRLTARDISPHLRKNIYYVICPEKELWRVL